MPTNKFLSILIPVYNAKRFLPRCLDSVLCQETNDLEIVIVDDGSTDGSGAICDDYAARCPLIRVYHKDNEGVSKTRNMLLDKAEGEYIWFVDADDRIVNNCIEKIQSKLNADNTIDMLALQYQYGHSKSATTWHSFNGTGEKYICEQGSNGYLWSWVIRRSIIVDNRVSFVPELFAQEDWLFLSMLFPHVLHLHESDIFAYRYEVDNTQSVMRQKTPESHRRHVDSSILVLSIFLQYLGQFNGRKIHKAYLRRLNLSATGLIYCLLPLRWSSQDVLQVIDRLKSAGIYPMGDTGVKKINLFQLVANHPRVLIMANWLWKKLRK